MKKLLCTLLAFPLVFAYGQTCNKLNHNCSNTSGLNTSGVISNNGGIYACAPGDNVLYTNGSNAYIATDDIQIAQGNAVTLHFEAKKNSTYFGTCEVWVHVGGWCNFTVYTTPFNDNGWVQIGTFSPNTTCSNFGPFTVPSDVIGGQQISYCIVPKNSSSSNWVAIDDICVSEISGSAVPTTMYEDFGTSSSGWYPNAGVDDIPYHTYKNASDAYTLLSFGADGGSDKAAYFYTGFDFCSSVSGVGIITKEVNTSSYSNGEIRLQFKSKYPCSGTNSYTFDESYQNYSPEVFVMTGADNGSNTWNALPVNYYFADYNWRVASYDISAYKNANVRFKIERGGFCGTAMEAVDNIKILDRDCSISLLSCGTIAGETAPLQNTDYPYSVPAVTGATYYKWYVRHDGNLYDTAPYIVSGQGTQNPTINFQTLPASGVRVLCIPFDVDPASNPDACYAEIGILGVIVSTAVPFVLDSLNSLDPHCNLACTGSVEIFVSGGQPPYTYSWVPNVSTTSLANNLCAGPYEVTVTDQNSDQIVQNVTLNNPFTPSLICPSGGPYCDGDTIQASLTFGGGLPPYNFTWTPSTGLSSSNIADPMVYLSTTSNYTVSLSDQCGDVVQCNWNPIVDPLPELEFTFGIYCADETDPLPTFVGSGAAGIFTSSAGLIINPTTGEVDLDASTPGTYTVINSGTLGSCSGSFSDDITINAIPTPTFISSSVNGCAPVSISFSETSIGSVNCDWDFGDGNTANGCSVVNNTYTTPGTYDLTLTTTNFNGCTSSTVYNDYIVAYASPTVDAGADASICQGETVTFTADNPDSGILSWNNGVTDGVSFVPSVAGYYVVESMSLEGCIGTDSLELLFNTPPVIDLGPDFTFCDAFTTLDGGAGMDSYLWSTSETTQTIDVSTSNDYWVTVELNGCFATDTVNVTRLDCTGIVEFGGKKVSVYPNPANDIVLIKDFPINTQLSIVSAKGDVIYSSLDTGTQTELDVSTFESGVYLIRLSNDSESKTIRLVKN